MTSMSEETLFEANEKRIKTYVFFTYDGTGLPISWNLKKLGQKVLVGYVNDLKKHKIGKDREDKESKRRRLSVYNGILDKMDADVLAQQLGKVRDKSDIFIFFDTNKLWRISEYLVSKGFTTGLFPSQWDFELEKNRTKAKEFVKKYYPGVEIPETKEFDKTEDAIDFLQESNSVWVLKSEGDHVFTIVPEQDDPSMANKVLISVLKSEKEAYEAGKFILERKITGQKEYIPTAIFYDGKPVYAYADIELKYLGAGNKSKQVGCAGGAVVAIDPVGKLADIAFPDKVREEAKKRPGMFVWDIGLMDTGDKLYMTEFCSNRVGWNAFLSELDMSGYATQYFNKIMNGISPLQRPIGTNIRIFNLHKDEEGRLKEGLTLMWDKSIDPHTWIFEVKKEKGKYVNTGGAWDMAVITSSGKSIVESAITMYEHLRKFSFLEGYYRPKFDFLSTVYSTSILNRYEALLKRLQ